MVGLDITFNAASLWYPRDQEVHGALNFTGEHLDSGPPLMWIL